MKTIICDIDGTLIKYLGNTIGMTHNDVTPLPGVIDHMNRWEQEGHRIILMTGRRESLREKTEDDIKKLGIPYDLLLMGHADTGRIVINDEGSKVKAHAVSLKRDEGFLNEDWERVGLTKLK